LVNAGTLAPGNSIGTITVQGDLSFASGSTYEADIAPASADCINVTGATAPAGTAHALFQTGATTWSRNYSLLSAAGGLAGTTFDALTTANLPAGFTASLDYGAHDVLLTLAAAPNTAHLSRNERRLADAVSAYFNDGGSLPAPFVTALGLSGEAQKTALSRLSGEAHAGAQAGARQASNQFLSLMFAPRVSGPIDSAPTFGLALPRAVPIAYALGDGSEPSAPEEHARAWASTFGGASTTDGSAATGSHGLSARAYGFAAGIDHPISSGTTLGFAFSGGSSFWSLQDGLGGGASRDFQLGLNATARDDNLYGTAALSYGFHRTNTERYALDGSRLTADFDAQSLGGRIEGGARLTAGDIGLTPYTAVQVQSFFTPSYSENDPAHSGLALSYEARTVTATRAELGSRFDRTVQLDDATRLKLESRVAYAHDWTTDPSLTPAFQALPGASFTVDGARPPANLGLLSLGADLFVDRDVSLSARFDGEFSGRSASCAGTAPFASPGSPCRCPGLCPPRLGPPLFRSFSQGKLGCPN
jgi:outer membrane autotransporter protein